MTGRRVGGGRRRGPSQPAPPRVAAPAVAALRVAALLAAMLLGPGLPIAALAAGHHHAVDDAALLDPGQCQLEGWVERANGGARRLQHLEPACRIGPVELAIAGERERPAGEGWTTGTGLQLKWARPLTDSVSIGVVASSRWQDRGRAYDATTLVVPLTLRVDDALAVHLNAGRRFASGAPDDTRGGLGIEWTPVGTWTVIAEVYREERETFRRAGLRWALSPSLSIDLSHARGRSGGTAPWWTLGFGWVYDR